jgi:DNA polymerase V
MGTLGVGEVWGVGSRIRSRLQEMGIATVLQLKCAPAARIRAEFGVGVERILFELNGRDCLELDEETPRRQQIICSRSFGMAVTRLLDMEQAVISYTSRAAEKLRRQQSVACCVQVFIRTNPHRLKEPQYQQTQAVSLPAPADDTRLLCHAALGGLRQIYRCGYAYQKAGVILSGIVAAAERQFTLFDDAVAQHKSEALMVTMDQINHRMGSGTVYLMGAGVEKDWAMKRGAVSPRYTTELTELAVAKAQL